MVIPVLGLWASSALAQTPPPTSQPAKEDKATASAPATAASVAPKANDATADASAASAKTAAPQPTAQVASDGTAAPAAAAQKSPYGSFPAMEGHRRHKKRRHHRSKVKLPWGVKLTPHVQYRARFLFRDNQQFTSTPTTELATHRARLGLDLQIRRWWRLFVQVQDIRTWGEETNTLTDYSGNGIDFHQAYAEVGCPDGLMLRVGRQELSLDNERLVGAVDWSDPGRAFDGIRLGYTYGDLAVHAFWAKLRENDITLADGNSPPTHDLGGLWIHYEGLSFLRPSVVLLFDRTSAQQQDRITTGVYVDGEVIKGLKYSAEFYFQGGEVGTYANTKTISAILAAGRLGYTAPLWGKPTLEAWVDYLSGDDNANDNKVKSFDTLFATNHKFYGFMDYYTNIPVHTKGLGLVDAGGRAKLSPKRWLSLFVDYHHFSHAADGPKLGSEIDLLVHVKFNRFAWLTGCLGTYIPSAGETATFGFVTANLAI